MLSWYFCVGNAISWFISTDREDAFVAHKATNTLSQLMKQNYGFQVIPSYIVRCSLLTLIIAKFTIISLLHTTNFFLATSQSTLWPNHILIFRCESCCAVSVIQMGNFSSSVNFKPWKDLIAFTNQSIAFTKQSYCCSFMFFYSLFHMQCPHR